MNKIQKNLERLFKIINNHSEEKISIGSIFDGIMKISSQALTEVDKMNDKELAVEMFYSSLIYSMALSLAYNYASTKEEKEFVDALNKEQKPVCLDILDAGGLN